MFDIKNKLLNKFLIKTLSIIFLLLFLFIFILSFFKILSFEFQEKSLVENRYFRIKNLFTKKYLDVIEADYKYVVQREKNNVDSQKWKFEKVNNGYFKIINKKYGFCIDVKGDSYNDGVNLYLNSDNSNLYQKWIILKNLKSHFKILASSSGKSIEVPYSSFNENEKMILYIPNNTKNQEWILVY